MERGEEGRSLHSGGTQQTILGQVMKVSIKGDVTLTACNLKGITFYFCDPPPKNITPLESQKNG